MQDWQQHGPNLADAIHGEQPPTLDDPGEEFFEASKLRRATLAYDSAGVSHLERSPWLVAASARAGKRFPHRPSAALPAPAWPDAPLGDVMRRRRSAEGFTGGAITAQELATVLSGACGVTGRQGDHLLHTAPSAGALQPLDIYVVVEAVEGLDTGVHHVDPVSLTLSHLSDRRAAAFAEAAMAPGALDGCAALIVVAGAFWRSRFKYGQRGLRFVLIEVGHVCQNLSLIATAMSLGSRVHGGFLDDDVARLLDLDGVNEAPLCLVAVGRPTAAP
jgi:SagB-type dehydrogenase family enzyme